MLKSFRILGPALLFLLPPRVFFTQRGPSSLAAYPSCLQPHARQPYDQVIPSRPRSVPTGEMLRRSPSSHHLHNLSRRNQ